MGLEAESEKRKEAPTPGREQSRCRPVSLSCGVLREHLQLETPRDLEDVLSLVSVLCRSASG